MWVVFIYETNKGQHSHKYFNDYETAKKYHDMILELMVYSSVTLSKIFTED